VLILEAGGNDNWIWFHIPVGYLFAIGNPRSDWMFKTEPEAGPQRPQLAYPRGKVIGGSSAINAMISMRGQAADYDHWRQLGLPAGAGTTCCRRSGGWRIIFSATASIMAPAAAGGSKRRGCPGTIWMRSAMPRNRWASGIADFNTGDNEGVGYFHVNQKRGRRWSAARGFPQAGAEPANLRLEKNVLVDRLIVEQTAAPSACASCRAAKSSRPAPRAK
jgi:choline dehydrogenase